MKVQKLRAILSKAQVLKNNGKHVPVQFHRLDAALQKHDKLTLKQLAKKLQAAKS